MGGSGDGHGGIVDGYGTLRRDLDEAGYRDVLPLEGLPLVQHLFRDLTQTTNSLQKAIKQYSYYKQIAQELESGVGPFKEENVRLIRENSHLRMAAVRASEDCEDSMQSVRKRVEELEEEKVDLKQLVKQLSQRLELLTFGSIEKSEKIVQFRETLESKEEVLEQNMDFDASILQGFMIPDPCPFCVRVRNFAEYDNDRDQNAADYFKIADARIEALKLQIRALKDSEKEMNQLVTTMKGKVENRDREIEKLRQYVTVRPGKDNVANGMNRASLASNKESNKDLELHLQSAQMQLDLLQKRNINLEKKLKSAILQEHDDFMMGRTRTNAERDLLRSLAALDVDNFPTHPEMNLNEKLQNLEAQLSNCCKEKAALKAALEKCEAKHAHHRSGGALGIEGKKSKSQGDNSRHPLQNMEDVPSIVPHDTDAGHSSGQGQTAEEHREQKQKTNDTVKSDRGLLRHPTAVRGTMQSSATGPARSMIKHKSVVASKKPSVTISSTYKSKPHISSRSTNVQALLPSTSHQSGSQDKGLGQKKSSSSVSGPGVRPVMTRITASRPEGYTVQTGLDTKSLGTAEKKSSMSQPQPSNISSKTNTGTSQRNLKQDTRSKDDFPIEIEPVVERGTNSGSDSDFENSVMQESMLEAAFMSPHKKSHSSKRPGAAITKSTRPSQSDFQDVQQPKVSTKYSKGTRKFSEEKLASKSVKASVHNLRSNSQRSSTEDLRSDRGRSLDSDGDGGHDSDVGKQTYDDHRELRYCEVDTIPFDKNANENFLDSTPKSKRDEFAESHPTDKSKPEDVSRQRDRFKRSRSIRVEEEYAAEYKAVMEKHRQSKDKTEDGSDHKGDKAKNIYLNSKADPKSQPKNTRITTDKEEPRRKEKIPVSGKTAVNDGNPPLDMDSDEDDDANNTLSGSDSNDNDDDEIIVLKAGPGQKFKPGRKSHVSNGKKSVEREFGDRDRHVDRDGSTRNVDADYTKDLEEGLDEGRDDGRTVPSGFKSFKSDKGTPIYAKSRSKDKNRDDEDEIYDDRETGRNEPEQAESVASSGHHRSKNIKDSRSLEHVNGRTDPGASKRSRDKIKSRDSGRERLGRISESDNRSKSPNISPTEKQYLLKNEVSYLKEELDNKNAKLTRMNLDCDEHLQELNRLKLALQNAQQVTLGQPTSKESSWELEMEIQRLKRQIANFQKDVELLTKDKDNAVEEIKRLLREISVEKNKNENYKWSSQSLQKQFSTQSRPQLEDMEMQRRLRDLATREQDLEREIARLKSNMNAQDRNKNEMRLEIDHKDERISRLNQELNQYKTEFSKIQKGGKSSDYQVGRSAREQEQVMFLKRQNESLRVDLETIQKERDEAVRDNRRLANTISLSKDIGGMGISGGIGTSMDDIYQRAAIERGQTSSQLPQRDQFEMARRLRQQAAKEQQLDDEISRLRSSVTKLDRDKDEMRAELDRKDEKLARMNGECEKHLAELSRLQLSLKNSEYQLGHTGETAREHERELQLLKRQIESLRRDFESASAERDEAIKDCRRLAGAISKEEIERRSLNTEYEKKSKEADELRKQVQKYIEEVRRIEDLLLQKEEEMETLIEHYRSLSLEKNDLEVARGVLEMEASSIREDVRETVDFNITLKNQLTSQNTLITSYEEEIERLALEVTSLENQLAHITDKDKTSESDVKAARELMYTLDVKMDKLKLDLANAESAKLKLEAENQELKNHIQLLEEQLEIQIEKETKLQDHIARVREKEFDVERSAQDLTSERDQLSLRLMSYQTRAETHNEESSKFRLKSIELQNELDRTRRQLQLEKSQRETAIAELRRAQDQLNTSSTNSLLNAALTGSAATSGSDYGGASKYGASRTTTTVVPGTALVPPPLSGSGSGTPNTSGLVSGSMNLPFSPMSETFLETSPVGASTGRSRRDFDEETTP